MFTFVLGGRYADRGDLRVETVQHQCHRSAQVGDVGFLVLQRIEKLLEIGHPVQRELVVLQIGLVERDYERQLGLVENRTGVEHVGHERDRRGAANHVHNVDHDGRVDRCDCVGYDSAYRCAEREVSSTNLVCLCAP